MYQFFLSTHVKKAFYVYWKDSNENTHYIFGSNFSDFGSINWTQHVPSKYDRENTLLVLDDHMSSIKRVQQAISNDFRHIWYDDNWSFSKVDCYSFNTLCSTQYNPFISQNITSTNENNNIKYLDNFGTFRITISSKEHAANLKYFLTHMEIYFEFPPVFDACGEKNLENSNGYGSSPLALRRKSLLTEKETIQIYEDINGTKGIYGPEFIGYFAPYVRLVPRTSSEVDAIIYNLVKNTTPYMLSSKFAHLRVASNGTLRT